MTTTKVTAKKKKSTKTPEREMSPAEAHLLPQYQQHDHEHEHHHHDQDHHHDQHQDQQAGPEALLGVRSIIAIASGKGGVGKSTVSTNLAISLRQMGKAVGLLDADLYGPTQPGMLGAQGVRGKTNGEGLLVPTEKYGVRVVSMGLLTEENRPLVWRAPMATQMIQQFLGSVEWGALDYLLIDLPPGTGDVQLTLAQNARLAGVVIVTTPQEVAVGIAKKGLEMFRQLNIPILGIIENMSGFTCKHCGKETAVFKEGGGQSLAKSLGVPFLGAVPLDPEIMLSGDKGIPVLELAPQSHAAKAFSNIAAAVDQQTQHTQEAENAVEPREFGQSPTGDLLIEWPDGEKSTIKPYTLRLACACAGCIDEHTGKPTLDPGKVPANITIKSVQLVGRYALSATFSDGHNTGIYPFKKLRLVREDTKSFVPPAALLPNDMKTQIESVLELQINPSLAGHGGRVDLVKIKDGDVYLKMGGGCQGCGSAKMTLQEGVEKSLRAQVAGIKDVIDVTDHDSGQNPYYK